MQAGILPPPKGCCEYYNECEEFSAVPLIQESSLNKALVLMGKVIIAVRINDCLHYHPWDGGLNVFKFVQFLHN